MQLQVNKPQSLLPFDEQVVYKTCCTGKIFKHFLCFFAMTRVSVVASVCCAALLFAALSSLSGIDAARKYSITFSFTEHRVRVALPRDANSVLSEGDVVAR